MKLTNLLMTVLAALAVLTPAAVNAAGDELAERLEAHARFLASPALRGRFTGSPEIQQAAEYLGDRFRRAGLRPCGDTGYFQPFELQTGASVTDSSLSLTAMGVTAELTAASRPLAFSADGEASGEPAFVGYGVVSGEKDWNSFNGIDLTGRIAIVLRGEPRDEHGRSLVSLADSGVYSDLRTKAVQAHSLGAVGMIVVTPPGFDPTGADEFVPLSGASAAGGSPIPVIHVKRDALDEVFENFHFTVGSLEEKIKTEQKPYAFLVRGSTASMGVKLEREYTEASNVVGMLDVEGTDEAVVIGAHYDHEGTNDQGEILPGADDNASGVAVTLELARLLKEKASAGELKRDVIFVCFSGEELGLLGSAHFVKHPPVPLENMIGMLNMDMVGRPTEGRFIAMGVDTGTGMEEIAACERAALMPLGSFAPSDASSFHAAGVPALFFFSGAHTDYNTPRDTADRLNYEGMSSLTRDIETIALRLINADERPGHLETAAPKGAVSRGDKPTGESAGLGTIPDFARKVDKGFAIGGVRPGSPADQAGIRGGDTMLFFGDYEIADINSYVQALRAHAPGDKVKIVLIRDGEKLTVEATLEVSKR